MRSSAKLVPVYRSTFIEHFALVLDLQYSGYRLLFDIETVSQRVRLYI